MVERITLLEPHFDGAQFGPSTLETDGFERSDSGEPDDADESSGQKSRGTILVQGLIGFVLMFIVLYVSLRALSGDDEDV